MLWFDVSDLLGWHFSHLTGIQRTVAGVLSEILKIREDIGLFAYNQSTFALEQTDFASLPPNVQRHLGLPKMSPDADGASIAQLAVSQPVLWSGRHPRQSGLAVYLNRGYHKYRGWIVPKIRRLLGNEVADALRDCVASSFRFVRSVIEAARRARPEITARVENDKPQSWSHSAVPARPLLFRAGDVCLSLSATWGLSRYGDAIAANKEAGSVKCINLIYDLIPALYPQWLILEVPAVFALWARQQIENADLILTISNFQKLEIAKYIEDAKLPSRPIEVIRLGDDPESLIRVASRDALPLPRFVPERSFALCVSTIDIRKNQGLLYQVWRRLAEELGPKCPQLLLIGMPHLHVSDLLYQIRNDEAVNKLIVHLQGIEDEELAWYYKFCLFTLYPSVYEGWGLPISESLALGKYCIAGNRTSLPEAGGEFADYFDPIDVIGCLNLVRRAVTDPEYVRQRELFIRKDYAPYTWSMTAEHISRVVDSFDPPK